MITLSWLDLALSASVLILLAGISVVLGLVGMGRKIIFAGLRTTVQLLAIGWVLKLLFSGEHPVWIALMAVVMVALAGYEVRQRQHRRFKGWWSYGMGSSAIFLSSFVLTLLTLTLIIQADPWYKAQYAIPLLGMILGNTMNGISLGLDRLTQGAWDQRETIEARLMLGQPWCETISHLRRDSIRTGLIPILNAMAAAGIITLPGMMTGQILAGASPLEAVKYQILIMFLIAAGTGFGTITAVYLGAARLFDERHRLCLDRLH
jgi:putative ABC transport system permease protein